MGDRRRGRWRLLAYCAVSGVTGTAAACAVYAAVPGAAKLGAFIAALVAVTVSAGLAYGHVLASLKRCLHAVARLLGARDDRG